MNPIKTLITSLLVGALASACAVEGATQTPAAETDTATAALGVCPATLALKLDRQKKAGYILRGLLGDSSMITDQFVKVVVDQARSNHFTSSPLPGGGYTEPKEVMSIAPNGTVCGIPASFVRFAQNPAWNGWQNGALVGIDFQSIANQAEAAWPGITPFLHTSNCSSATTCTFDFDPEPAQLGAPLSGSTGASASAAYVNSSDPVTARKWTSTFSSCSSNCPAPMQPCAASNLAAGATVPGIIERAPDGSSRYKCTAQ
jgi:hypothetical protein